MIDDLDFSSPPNKEDARSPDIIDALLGLWRARILLLAACAIGAVLAVIYVVRAPALYTAQLTFTPSEASPTQASNRLSSLASLAGISGGSETTSPFDLFLLALQSRQVATSVTGDEATLKQLFPARWDTTRNRWITDADRTGHFSVRHALGLPVPPLGRPTPSEVNDTLNDRVTIGRNLEHGTATIMFDDTDPVFAARFIARIADAADGIVKARTLAHSNAYIGYIENKLRSATLAEDRQVLAAELGARERAAMLASSGLPFAGDPLGAPTTSTVPTSPRLGLSLAIGVAGGFSVGLFILLVLQVRQRARRQRD